MKSTHLMLLLVLIPALSAAKPEHEALAERLPGVEAGDIRATQIEGLFEVTVGSRVLYISSDGRYMIQGQMIDLEERINLTEARSAEVRAEWVSGLPESEMVIFEPEGGVEHTITVFTDVDCGYCRALHAEIDELTALGIRVRYLLYPRDGLDTESATKHVSIWCAEDRHDALTRAKAGERIPASQCEGVPLAANLQRGREATVRGTPTIISDAGALIRGYMPARRLLDELRR